MQLILASKSPRRNELLALLGVPFTTFDADIDETPLDNESAEQLVERLAKAKAAAALACYPDAWVIGSDTVISLEGRILAKPNDADDAIQMLRAMQGRRHQVLTSLALLNKDNEQLIVDQSTVTFAALNERQIAAYVATGEGVDKAGGYGIQGIAASFIEQIEGNYHSIMGLPLAPLRKLFDELHIEYWRS